MATRTRYVNFGGLSADQPPTHDEAFIAAFKRQYRGAQAAAELDSGSSDMLDSYGDRFGADAAAKLAAKLAAAKGELVADAKVHEKDDARILESVEVEVVEVDTVSGPRVVWEDAVAQYEARGVLVEGSAA